MISLLEAADELGGARSLQDVLRRILTLAGGLIHSSAGSVLLHDPRRNDLYFAASTGPAAEDLKDIRVPLDKSKAGQVFVSLTPIVEDHLTGHYERVDNATRFQTHSMICVPLIHQGRALGVMQMLNKADGTEPYTARDLELLRRFGVQATHSIRHAALFEQMLGSCGLHAADGVRSDIVERLTSSESFAIRESLTILAADMRGFSRLCQGLRTPGRIQEMLGEYIAMLASIVVHHHGILNKVIGDGIVALFRTSSGPANAVRAAFDMSEQFTRFRDRWAERFNFSVDFLDIGIGIATDDDMILGTVGDDQFRDVTIIGQAVNLASALVTEARGGKRILCDKLTWLAVRGAGGWCSTGPEQLRIDKLDGALNASYEIHSLQLPAAGPASPEPPKPTGDFDIFISYRRDGGGSEARSIQQALDDDYRIFLDVDRMPSGHFDEALLRTIASSPNFVVILSKTAFERIHLEGDWLCREIAHAITNKVNIVPVVLPGFHFPHPNALPEEIRELVRHDAVEYSHRYFHPTIDKIREHLKTAR